MQTMTDETSRYYNPVTLLTEQATPSYAATVGLIPLADDAETQIGLSGQEFVVIAGEDLSSLSKPELVQRAEDLDLDTSGTKADIIERIEARAAEVEAASDGCIGCPPKGGTESTILVSDPVVLEPNELHGDSAAGEEDNINPQKEG